MDQINAKHIREIYFLSIFFIILKSLPTVQYLQNKLETMDKLFSSKSQMNQAHYFVLHLNQICKENWDMSNSIKLAN